MWALVFFIRRKMSHAWNLGLLWSVTEGWTWRSAALEECVHWISSSNSQHRKKAGFMTIVNVSALLLFTRVFSSKDFCCQSLVLSLSADVASTQLGSKLSLAASSFLCCVISDCVNKYSQSHTLWSRVMIWCCCIVVCHWENFFPVIFLNRSWSKPFLSLLLNLSTDKNKDLAVPVTMLATSRH